MRGLALTFLPTVGGHSFGKSGVILSVAALARRSPLLYEKGDCKVVLTSCHSERDEGSGPLRRDPSLRSGSKVSPNPPKETDGRREDRDSVVRELLGDGLGSMGRWEVGGRSSAATGGPDENRWPPLAPFSPDRQVPMPLTTFSNAKAASLRRIRV